MVPGHQGSNAGSTPMSLDTRRLHRAGVEIQLRSSSQFKELSEKSVYHCSVRSSWIKSDPVVISAAVERLIYIKEFERCTILKGRKRGLWMIP